MTPGILPVEDPEVKALQQLPQPKRPRSSTQRTYTPSVHSRPLPGVVGRRDDLDLDEES
jgi:hypothetical protein